MDIRLAVVSLRTEDVPAVTHFYRDVIGLRLQAHSSGGLPHFDLVGTILTIMHGSPCPPTDLEPRFPVIAFAVPNLETALGNLHKHGVILP
jgi:catechol 2,3-dioxygenase-like lactoylglutathione lyase family enzyme